MSISKTQSLANVMLKGLEVIGPVPQLRASISSTQNWAVPAGVNTLLVLTVGGGGGGGNSTNLGGNSGGGGGGATLAQLAVTPGTTASITIGSGGTGGTTGINCTAGGTTYFTLPDGRSVSAVGGGPGVSNATYGSQGRGGGTAYYTGYNYITSTFAFQHASENLGATFTPYATLHNTVIDITTGALNSGPMNLNDGNRTGTGNQFSANAGTSGMQNTISYANSQSNGFTGGGMSSFSSSADFPASLTPTINRAGINYYMMAAGGFYPGGTGVATNTGTVVGPGGGGVLGAGGNGVYGAFTGGVGGAGGGGGGMSVNTSTSYGGPGGSGAVLIYY